MKMAIGRALEDWSSKINARFEARSCHSLSLGKGLVQTDCSHRAIRNARSIPDADISRLGVGNAAPISMIAAPAPGEKRTFISDAIDCISKLSASHRVYFLIEPVRAYSTRPTMEALKKQGEDMGEAKRRKAEIEKFKSRESDWFARLNGDEKIVAEVAKAAFEIIVVERDMTGGCYNLAFFLREYLKREKGIDARMVVGWVTDDSWEGAISHAWIEYGGKKTDISLWHTEFPAHQLPGSVIIHDFDYRRGVTEYTYRRELPQSNRDYLDLASKNAEFGHQYKHKEAEHLMIKALAEKAGGAIEYFSAAPTEMKYETLAGLLA